MPMEGQVKFRNPQNKKQKQKLLGNFWVNSFF